MIAQVLLRLTNLRWAHVFLAFKCQHGLLLVKTLQARSIGIEGVVVVISKSLQNREQTDPCKKDEIICCRFVMLPISISLILLLAGLYLHNSLVVHCQQTLFFKLALATASGSLMVPG